MGVSNVHAEPLVSIICPVYNGALYIGKCIQSLVDQTLENIEIICVDDASTDNSMEILEEFRLRYPYKIRIVSYPDNRRVGGARNAGIKAARAKYVGFCDSDDFVSPDMYKKLYEETVATDSDMTVVQAAVVSESDTVASIKNVKHRPYEKWHKNLLRWNGVDITDNNLAHNDMLAYPIGGVFCRLIKKSIITDNDVWFPEGISYEDNYWVSLLSVYVNKVVFIDSILYYYVSRMDSQTHQRNKTYHFKRKEIENSLLEAAKNRGFLERYFEGWEFTYIQRYAINTIRLLISAFDKYPKDVINGIRRDLNHNFHGWKKNKYFTQTSHIDFSYAP